jgi:K+-transporting ATPase ATPase C chain
MRHALERVRASGTAILVIAVVAGGIYPIVVWLIGQVFAPEKATGSLVTWRGEILGSSLLGQEFAAARYFHPRPSAAGTGYDATASRGSNRGPLSADLIRTVKSRAELYRIENRLAPSVPIPADAVTASGSGLDPHISPENATIQAPRVARTRGLDLDVVMTKVRDHTEGRTLGIFGEPRVNVLLLNLDLDGKL